MKELGKSGYLQKLMWLSGVSDSHEFPCYLDHQCLTNKNDSWIEGVSTVEISK
jgi:hypothetical protein